MELKIIKWDITGTCNLKCIHCSAGGKYVQGKNKEISLEQKFEIIDRLAEGGVNKINLLGGEPLTLGDDFFSIIKYGVSKGISMSSNTNGLLLNNTVIKKMVDAEISGLTVSIDGPSPETHDEIRGKGTFKKIIDNVKDLTEYISREDIPMNISVNTVLNKQNYRTVENMIDLCLSLGVDKWNLLKLWQVGHAKDNINNLNLTTEDLINTAVRVARNVDPNFNDLKDLKFDNLFASPLVSFFINQEYGYELPDPGYCCPGSLNLGFVDPYGNMFACDTITGYIDCSINSAPIKAMNLLDYGFYEIWNSDYFVQMFPLMSDAFTYRNYEPCNRCKFLHNRTCLPCPLDSLRDGKVVFKECLYIEQKLGDIKNLKEEKQIDGSQHIGESKIKIDLQEYNNVKVTDFGNQYPTKVNGIRSYKKNEKYILFNPYTLNASELNKMGTRIWDLIDGDISVQGIVKVLSGEINSLPVSEELFREKVVYFLHLLNKKQLISFSDYVTVQTSVSVNT